MSFHLSLHQQGFYPFMPRDREIAQKVRNYQRWKKKKSESLERNLFLIFCLDSLSVSPWRRRKKECLSKCRWGHTRRMQSIHLKPGLLFKGLWQDWRMWQIVTWLNSTMTEVSQPRKIASVSDGFGIEFCPLKYTKKK